MKQISKITRLYLYSVLFFLLLAMIAKCSSLGLVTSPYWDKPDPLLKFLDNRQMAIVALGMDLLAIFLVLLIWLPELKLLLVSSLGLVFLIYHAGLWQVGYKGPCPCYGLHLMEWGGGGFSQWPGVMVAAYFFLPAMVLALLSRGRAVGQMSQNASPQQQRQTTFESPRLL